MSSWGENTSRLRPKREKVVRRCKKRLKRRGLLRALMRRLSAARDYLSALVWGVRNGVGMPTCAVRTTVKSPRYYRGARLALSYWQPPLELRLDPPIDFYSLGAKGRLALRRGLPPKGDSGAARLITRVTVPYQPYWRDTTTSERGRPQYRVLPLSLNLPLFFATTPLEKSPPAAFNDQEPHLTPPSMPPRDAESVVEQRATHSLSVPFQSNQSNQAVSYQVIPNVISLRRAVITSSKTTTASETTAAQADSKDKNQPHQHRVPRGKPRVMCQLPGYRLDSKCIVLNKRCWRAGKIAEARRRGRSGNRKRIAKIKVGDRMVAQPRCLVCYRPPLVKHSMVGFSGKQQWGYGKRQKGELDSTLLGVKLTRGSQEYQ